MIHFAGEILADIFIKPGAETKICLGGAPFNAAVSAQNSGATVTFSGRVGNDVIGKILCDDAKRYLGESVELQIDKYRNTTLAFVKSNNNGERSFSFFRHETADYYLNADEIDWDNCSSGDIFALGTLMLDASIGRETADIITEKCAEKGLLLAIDVNFRSALFDNKVEMVSCFLPLLKKADYIKLSAEEMDIICPGLDTAAGLYALNDLFGNAKLIVLTLGEHGSAALFDKRIQVLPSTPIKPIDTTGAGDAFWGTFLALIDGKVLTHDLIKAALSVANRAGAEATQYRGALKPLL